MNAVIASRADFALLLEGEQFQRLNPDGSSSPLAPDEARRQLHQAHAPLFLQNVTPADVRKELQRARDSDRVLDLSLLVLDGEISDSTRDKAVRELDAFLVKASAPDLLLGVLWSTPAPRQADLDGAVARCLRLQCDRSRDLFHRLTRDQSLIAEVGSSWEQLPTALFGTDDARQGARAAFVRAGLFFALCQARVQASDPPLLLAKAAADPLLSGVSGAREILQRWIELQPKFRPTIRTRPSTAPKRVPRNVTRTRVAA